MINAGLVAGGSCTQQCYDRSLSVASPTSPATGVARWSVTFRTAVIGACLLLHDSPLCAPILVPVFDGYTHFEEYGFAHQPTTPDGSLVIEEIKASGNVIHRPMSKRDAAAIMQAGQFAVAMQMSLSTGGSGGVSQWNWVTCRTSQAYLPGGDGCPPVTFAPGSSLEERARQMREAYPVGRHAVVAPAFTARQWAWSSTWQVPVVGLWPAGGFTRGTVVSDKGKVLLSNSIWIASGAAAHVIAGGTVPVSEQHEAEDAEPCVISLKNSYVDLPPMEAGVWRRVAIPFEISGVCAPLTISGDLLSTSGALEMREELYSVGPSGSEGGYAEPQGWNYPGIMGMPGVYAVSVRGKGPGPGEGRVAITLRPW